MEDLETINTEFNIVNHKLYIVLDNYDENEFYLTKDAEYRGFGPIHHHYAAEVGDITLSNDQFKISPYSAVGSKGLEFTQNTKKIEISAQNAIAKY